MDHPDNKVKFLENIHYHEPSDQEAVYAIVSLIDDLFLEGKFDEVNDILVKIKFDNLNSNTMIALVISSWAGSKHLPEWPSFLERAHKKLEELTSIEYAAQLLQGIYRNMVNVGDLRVY